MTNQYHKLISDLIIVRAWSFKKIIDCVNYVLCVENKKVL